MNKALRATILVVVFALSFVGTTLLLQGCGGGGGAVGGDNVSPATFGGDNVSPATFGGDNVNPATLRGAVGDVPDGRHWRSLSRIDQVINRSRSRQSGDCPRIESAGNSITLDYGSGCQSAEDDEIIRGRVTIQLVNPNYAAGKLVNVDRIEFRFENYGTQEETITGTMSLRNIDRDDAFGLSYDLTPRGECEERERFNGTVVYSAGWFSDRFYITGNGDYAAPAVGTVSFQMRNVQYEFPDNLPGCDYPIGGQMTVTAGGQTGTVTFRSTCGIARINIGGLEEDIDLDEIEFDACR